MATVRRRTRDGKIVGYEARWRDDRGKQRKKLFRKKSDADDHKTAIEHALLSRTYVDPAAGKVTVEEWSKTWMRQRVHLKPKTIAGYESLLRSRVIPHWGTVQLGRVQHADVVAWVAAMRAEGLSASRTRQAYHLLTGMLDDAVKDGRLARNTAAGVDLPRLPLSDRRYLTHEELEALASECGEHRVLVLVLGYCGLRWGEVVALRVRNVDLMRSRINVREAASEVNGRVLIESPKTHEVRSVPIPIFLRDELAAHVAGLGQDELVFASTRGVTMRVGSWRRTCFDSAAARAGLEGLTPHELRHTAASLAIAAGANVKAVQAMLGHKSAAMTLDRYGHLMDGDLDVLAEHLSAARDRAVPQMCPTATVSSITERETAV